MKEEWRIFETKNPKLKDKFLCGFIDKKKTEARKCVRCKSVFSCKKSNTSALERHISSCTSTESEDVNQISIRKFLNSNTEKFTFHSQFVYLDNVSATKVSSSPRFKKLFQKSGLAVPTYDDLNRTLNAKYFERIDIIKKLLEGKEKLVLALDKWTNNHHEKFIGVYVYQKGKSIFLGLINYDFSCGAKEMKKYTKELLAKFGIAKERLACVMSDCGSDMVKFCRIMKLAHVPCLAHVINLIVKKMINASLIHDDAIETDNEVAIQTDEEIVIQIEDSNNENDTDEADEDFDTLNTRSIEPFDFSNFVNEKRQAVKDIRTPNNKYRRTLTSISRPSNMCEHLSNVKVVWRWSVMTCYVYLTNGVVPKTQLSRRLTNAVNYTSGWRKKLMTILKTCNRPSILMQRQLLSKTSYNLKGQLDQKRNKYEEH